ncbi:protein cornichon 1-like protein [Carex littledalei]|uniref:Protein cornichon 1-like protein n=1 Tax=Carex littledalei TaxID=544730 RepID=A0A833RMW6_9POAL|nr:protein cornichon 1-like protein [Carex littledalei]
MSWELMLWLFAFVSVISLIGLSLYQLITLSDLEFDYINPFDSSNRINAVVLPEFILQAVLCASFLLTWHWFSFLITLPVTCYHLKLYMKRKHLVDVTEIFRSLHWEKKYRIIKLAFYVTIFVIVIYRLVLTAVTLLMDDEDVNFINSGTL